MKINAAQQASRQQLQDDVLALIRSRSQAMNRANAPDRVPGDRSTTEPAAGPAASQVDAAVDKINQALKVLSTSLRFEVDEQSERMVVKVVDRDSGDVLRQIPSEATLQIARSLDRVLGHLVDQSV
ncbi:flagellar protein FlaG [Ramlibacter sp.]|uniref:flagellar protein FlaG n=1 Tax=Ramlibacter sp. TaxID=1917967 RepID=UPI002CC61074|nr:flagellar protein FlaG [Ramlibacter sp.]HWI83371.1 flagellar protein FlaG [Ramlibacter sp.]